MKAGGTLGAALLATLANPTTWVVALAGFLVRGGFLLVLLPIVTLPTPVGLANLVGPTLVAFVFGGVSVGFAELVIAIALSVLAWIVIGGFVAAAVEADGIQAIAADEQAEATNAAAGTGHGALDAGVGPLARPRFGIRRSAVRIEAVRIVLMLPLIAVIAWGSTRVVAVAYRELTNPGDVAVPIVWRVLGAVPDVVIAIAVAWLIGEMLGATTARHLILEETSVVRAIGRGLGDLVRRPLTSLLLFVVPAAALLLVLVPTAAATSVAWTALRRELQSADQPLLLAVALIAFIGLWLGGLALAGAVCAWRQAAWTEDLLRRRPGTFGVDATAPPGDWKRGASSVTL